MANIVKPYTFQAGQKARANEVNDNFDVLYTQVNSNTNNIASNASAITSLGNNKADLHGSSSNTFAVANPSGSGDAVNKRTVLDYMSNSIDYINGLSISLDPDSPSNTIIVSAGSCWDKTHTKILKLDDALSVENTGQVASTTYYVFIFGKDEGDATTIVIDNNSSTPSVPAGFSSTIWRRIGLFQVYSNNTISVITSASNNNNMNNDGQPVNSYVELSSGTSATTYTIDLYNYLPKDGNKYMVYLVAGANDNGTYTVLQTVTSDIWGGMPGINVVGGYADKSRSWFCIPVKRYLYYTISHSVDSAHLWYIGYRRIGANI